MQIELLNIVCTKKGFAFALIGINDKFFFGFGIKPSGDWCISIVFFEFSNYIGG